MKEEIKKLWVAALRSGMYQQGMGYLKKRHEEEKTSRYCCLGVLCDITKPLTGGEWAKSWFGGGVQGFMFGIGIEEERRLTGQLPEGPAKLVSGDETLFHAQTRLISMNDSGDTFAQIADWIEAYL